jgi:uncharacterized protein (DUF2062 family)
MVERVRRWFRRNAPQREDMLHNRWLRPFAMRTELWRFTRRSVPRGVAIGLLVGVFLMIPGLQIIGAAIMCVPLRGNIPIAAAMTFLSNPATTPFILLMSIMIGNWLGFHADLAAFQRLYERHAGVKEWLAWLASDAAPALISGLFVIGLGSAIVAYFISIVGWRWWTARKWKRRFRDGGTEP